MNVKHACSLSETASRQPLRLLSFPFPHAGNSFLPAKRPLSADQTSESLRAFFLLVRMFMQKVRLLLHKNYVRGGVSPVFSFGKLKGCVRGYYFFVSFCRDWQILKNQNEKEEESNTGIS